MRSLKILCFCMGLTVLGSAALMLEGCGGGTSTPQPDPGPAMDHSNIVLKDRFGAPLTVASAEPYSPRKTCGACHDVDLIANGYHFQQGRTDASGAIHMANNFFGDGRTWLKSDGMYGKW